MGRILLAVGIVLFLLGLVVKDLGFSLFGVGFILFVLSAPWHEEIRAKIRQVLNIRE